MASIGDTVKAHPTATILIVIGTGVAVVLYFVLRGSGSSGASGPVGQTYSLGTMPGNSSTGSSTGSGSVTNNYYGAPPGSGPPAGNAALTTLHQAYLAAKIREHNPNLTGAQFAAQLRAAAHRKAA